MKSLVMARWGALVSGLLLFGGCAGLFGASGPATPAAAGAYDGSWTNHSGATLKISNFVAGQGFDFVLSSEGEDACGGLKYGISVVHEGGNTYGNEQGDELRVGADTIEFEPSMDMIGMDCARVLEIAFERDDD